MTDGLRIGEVARQAGTTPDTVRYYERLGLLQPPARTESGYRCYSDADLGRLLFIRRAKQLGLSLEEIPALLGLAQKGDCQTLRQEVAALLRQKLDECAEKLAELMAFKASLEERYQLALQHWDEPVCACACLPV